ncbi:hypothetical protein Egran_02513 [Elaphomyces granulatus]|uniref:Uncharacterized protein n=1 Tax=Elaphomyces granulatus TaxID=519963 RepID=A0A232LZY4_9EURO|nr:hypothetical protein Egran_02513 [Elaphomyces granulatus]
MPFLHDPPIDEPVFRLRDLQDDEKFVLSEFERHASRCPRCANPLSAFRERRNLCSRGHQYAVDVAEYLYRENGRDLSMVDRNFNQPTEVKIPRDCIAARGLLMAIEEGLRVRRKDEKPPVIHSYDSTYYVPPRESNTRERYTEIIERTPAPAPAKTKHRRVIVYHRRSPSRGSLYESDHIERVGRHHESSRGRRSTEFFR